ncbi:anhydro-N-acetylmuramic acid kinase [Variovorax boronicumulans]|uniref:anhydro-N-acetylmuramic acid kinase n=1 Tax=Variovorax boronicumulans TaxID=436515 RepID=UPI001C56CC1E
MAERFIGLMSGTSLDGVDGVLATFSDAGRVTVVGHATADFPPALRAELLALNTAGDNELHRAALAANGLVGVYAGVVRQLLADTGLGAADVTAIGAHGQTVRHRPGEFDGIGYTLQLDNPALLAERAGIDVVADFRRRDVAAGGQGAPLVPAFHRAVFGRPDQTVGVLNLGGIANLSVLPAADSGGDVLGFDCGPGNALMDHWCQAHIGQPFDAGGRWAASGRVLPTLLARLRADPFFTKAPPKSTGRDLFHPAWLTARLGDDGAAPADVQATLCELTAGACADDLRRYGAAAHELVVCGGGALNTHLMTRLAALLAGVRVLSSAERGLPPQQVEAAAFAWLARATVRREPGNLASATGARGERVLGALYPA